LTARTRFVLWVALGQLAVALDLALQPAHDGKKPMGVASSKIKGSWQATAPGGAKRSREGL
jgi:hypothetical protein